MLLSVFKVIIRFKYSLEFFQDQRCFWYGFLIPSTFIVCFEIIDNDSSVLEEFIDKFRASMTVFPFLIIHNIITQEMA